MCVSVLVVLHTLDKGSCAVTYTNDGDADGRHPRSLQLVPIRAIVIRNLVQTTSCPSDRRSANCPQHLEHDDGRVLY